MLLRPSYCGFSFLKRCGEHGGMGYSSPKTDWSIPISCKSSGRGDGIALKRGYPHYSGYITRFQRKSNKFCSNVQSYGHEGGKKDNLAGNTSTSSIATRTSLYITGIGIFALLFPNLAIQCMVLVSYDLKQAALPPIYVQLGGALACLFGFYYGGAAMDDRQGRYPVRFYTSTIRGRYFLATVFGILFFIHGCLHLWVLILGIMNASSAFLLQRAVSQRAAEELES